MQGIEVSYLSAVAVGLCVVYVALFFLFQIIFKKGIHNSLHKKSFHSMFWIVVLSGIMYAISFYAISDAILGNRFLHAFGGGFMVFLLCLFVIRDAKISMTRSAFLLTSFMTVTLLGIFNEAFEIFLQQHIQFLFAPNALDTALDIVSNTLGFFIASLCLVPFSEYRPSRKRIAALQSE